VVRVDLLKQNVLGALLEDKRQTHFLQALAKIANHKIQNLLKLGITKLVEDNDLIKPVNEFRAEVLTNLLKELLGLIVFRPFFKLSANANGGSTACENV